MSDKVSSNNSFKMNNDPVCVKTASVDTSVKLAGEEAKDRLYEPKHKKKLVRVLTVVAYVFFVSLAGIMLSLYYVFLWNGYPKDVGYAKEMNSHRYHAQHGSEHDCRAELDERFDQELLQHLVDEDTSKTYGDGQLSTPIPTDDSEEDEKLTPRVNADQLDLRDISRRSLLYKKLFYKNIIMA